MVPGPQAARALVLVLLALLSSNLVLAAGPAVAGGLDPLQQQPAGPAMAQCQIKITGVTVPASIRCSGRVVINTRLPKPAYHSPGVIVDKDCGVKGCLLNICGNTGVTIINSTITGVSGVRAALCVWDKARVVLVNVNISGNSASAVMAGHESRLEITQGSLISDNRFTERGVPKDTPLFKLASGVSALGGAVVVIKDSQVASNTRCVASYNHSESITGHSGSSGRQDAPAGALVAGTATMKLVGNTSVHTNLVDHDCGGIQVVESGTLVVSGNTEIVKNRGAIAGGGICAADGATVTIAGDAHIAGNTCELFGCGVLVTDNSSVSIGDDVRIWRNGMRIWDRPESDMQNHLQIGCYSGAVASNRVTQIRSRIVASSPVTSRAAHGGSAGGGAIAVLRHGRILLTGHVQIGYNTMYGRGGGIYSSFCGPLICRGATLGDPTPVLNITGHVSFTNNVAESYGTTTPSHVAVDQNTVLHISAGVMVVEENGSDVPLTQCSEYVYINSVINWSDQVSPVNESYTACQAGMFVAGDRCRCCRPYTFDLGPAGRPPKRIGEECLRCPDNALCFDNKVVPEPGFWHSSPNSVQMHRCPLGNVSCAANGTCNTTKGYTGNLCGSCLSGWGMTAPFKCSPCMERPRPLLVYLAFHTVSVLLVSYTVHALWAEGRQGGGKTVRISDLIKVPVQFVQYLVILGSISAPWPAFLVNWFGVASAVWGSGQTAAVDCLVQQHFASSRLTPAIVRQLVFVIAPVAVLVAVMLLVCVWHGINLMRSAAYRRGWKLLGGKAKSLVVSPLHLVSRLRVAILVVTFYAYPTLVKAALSFFPCVPIDNKSAERYPQYALRNHTAGYWVFDIKQECWADGHKSWTLVLGLPLLILCVIAPVAIVVLMWCQRGKEPVAAFRVHFGFLYRNYVQGRLWWEAVWLVQTILLTVVAVFNHSIGVLAALLLMWLFLALSIVAQIWGKPYAEPLLHRLHLASTCLLLLSVWLTLMMQSQQSTQVRAPDKAEVVQQALGCILLVVDTAFVVWCIGWILRLAAATFEPTGKALACCVRLTKPVWEPAGKVVGSVKAAVRGLCGQLGCITEGCTGSMTQAA